MAELPERDTALFLDMLLAARDARGFVAGLDDAAFLASRLHQNAVIRSLEVLGEAAGKVSVGGYAGRIPRFPGARSWACAIVSSMAMRRYDWILSGWSFVIGSIL
jgi:hypothetical protein